MLKMKKIQTFDVVLTICMVAVSILILLPLLHVIASSLSDPEAVYTGKVGLWPVRFSLKSYKIVFAEENIWIGYKNTILYTLLGTVISLTLQMLTAYPLSRRDLEFRKFFMVLFSLTMFISGGMIPTYIVVKSLGMLNTLWAIIIPGCMGVFNIIIIRTFINTSIPWELQEAAMIDGCGNFRMFLTLILPLSKPILAVMCLYAIVGNWNSYFNALIYVQDVSKQPLQLVLRKILVSSDAGSIGSGTIGSSEAGLMSESLKFSTIIVSTLPILLIYPFFEKYFEKGMIMGSLKG